MNANSLPFAVKRRAIELFRNDVVGKRTQRHNQMMWLRARQILGDRYLLAMPVARRPADASGDNEVKSRHDSWLEEEGRQRSRVIELAATLQSE